MRESIAFLGLSRGGEVIFIAATLILIVFELTMLMSALLNKHISRKAKILWIIGMLLIHPFVAIAYLFTDFKKRD